MDIYSIAYIHKEKGNKFWEVKQYEEAKNEYSKALLAVAHIFKENLCESEADNKKLVKEIQIPCLLNLAACLLQLKKDYNIVIIHCDNVLKIDPQNVKAYYRKALAYIELEELGLATKELINAREIDPDNQLLKDTQIQLRNKKRNLLNKPAQKSFSLSTLIGKIILLRCKRKM